MGLDLGPSTGWDSAEAPHKALGLDRGLEGELAPEVDEAVGIHRAVGMSMALEFHTALDEDVELGVELGVELDVEQDTNKALKVAVVEDMGGAQDLRTVDMDVEQEVGTAAVMALDIDQHTEDVAPGVVSAPGRRHPRTVVGHSSGASV